MVEDINVFSVYWTTFHNKAVDLSHLLSFLPWQLRMSQKMTQQSLYLLEKQGFPGKFGPATGLSIIDLFRDSDIAYRAPAGKRATLGDAIEPMSSEVEGRFNNSVLLSLHEALEVYVKKLFEAMLCELRPQELLEKEGFHKAIVNVDNIECTCEYYNKYVRWSCRRDCRTAWKSFQQELDWSMLKVDDWEGLPWITVADTLDRCRNFIVHDEGRVADHKWNELRQQQKRFIKSSMRKSVLVDEERILFERYQAYNFLEAIVSLGYGVYVLLSKRIGMEIDVKLGYNSHV